MNKMNYETIEIQCIQVCLGPYEQSHLLKSFSHHPIHPSYAICLLNLTFMVALWTSSVSLSHSIIGTFHDRSQTGFRS